MERGWRGFGEQYDFQYVAKRQKREIFAGETGNILWQKQVIFAAETGEILRQKMEMTNRMMTEARWHNASMLDRSRCFVDGEKAEEADEDAKRVWTRGSGKS